MLFVLLLSMSLFQLQDIYETYISFTYIFYIYTYLIDSIDLRIMFYLKFNNTKLCDVYYIHIYVHNIICIYMQYSHEIYI